MADRGAGSLHGFRIDADLDLRRLSSAPGELGTVQVRAAEVPVLRREGEMLQVFDGLEGEPVYATARLGRDLLVWHGDAGSFLVDGSESSIAYRDDERRDPDMPPLRWEDRLGSTALPMLRAERGDLALHASAVALEDGCFLICGPSGAGKSTLAATLAARGHAALAEDGIVVTDGGAGVVWPGLSGSLITAEVADHLGLDAVDATADRRGRVLRFDLPSAVAPAPVRAAVLLREMGGTEVEVQSLSAATAHRELLLQSLIPGGPGVPRAFAASARLAERVPVVRMRVPERLDALEQAAEALERL